MPRFEHSPKPRHALVFIPTDENGAPHRSMDYGAVSVPPAPVLAWFPNAQEWEWLPPATAHCGRKGVGLRA